MSSYVDAEGVIIWCPMCDAGMLELVESSATIYTWQCEECGGTWTCGKASINAYRERKNAAMARAFR